MSTTAMTCPPSGTRRLLPRLGSTAPHTTDRPPCGRLSPSRCPRRRPHHLGEEPFELVEEHRVVVSGDHVTGVRDLVDVGIGQVLEQVPHRFVTDDVGHRATDEQDRKSTRLNSSHVSISYAVFCLKQKSQRQALALSY